MTPIDIYAIVVAGIVLATICTRLGHSCWSWLHWAASRLTRYLVFTNVGPQTRWLRPWSCSVVLVQAVVVGINLFLICYQAPGRQAIGQRAGEAAIITMGLFYLGPSLAYLADWFGASWSTMKQIHGGGVPSCTILVAVHAAIATPSQPLFTTPFSEQFYGVIAALALAVLLVACVSPVRRAWYEVFLRTHQALALGIWLTIWFHVRGGGSRVARYGVMASITCLGVGGVEPVIQTLILNKCFVHGMARARLSLVGHVVRVIIVTPTTFDVHAGQYIHVWMPRVSWSSCLQTHPFVVASVRHRGPGLKGLKMELMVEPCRGWTFQLERRAREGDLGSDGRPCRVLFSRPHGPCIPIDDYGSVVLAASGWGLMAQMPFLQHLIRGYHHGTTRARRIHLVWQLGHEGRGRPAKALLDQALLDDRASRGKILQISIYYRAGDLPEKDRRPGRRVAFHEGVVDWESLILAELGGDGPGWNQHAGQLEAGALASTSDLAFFSRERRTVVLVSAASPIRDRIRHTCRGAISPQLRLVELDYQPRDEHTGQS